MLIGAVHVELLDTLDRELLLLELDLVGIWGESRRETSHKFGESSREQDKLSLLRQHSRNTEVRLDWSEPPRDCS